MPMEKSMRKIREKVDTYSDFVRRGLGRATVLGALAASTFSNTLSIKAELPAAGIVYPDSAYTLHMDAMTKRELNDYFLKEHETPHGIHGREGSLEGNYNDQKPYNQMVRPIIERIGGEYSINPKLIAAIIHTESSWDPNAVSRRGAVGLMQLMPPTAAEYGYSSRQMTDPVKNIDAGSRHFKWLYDRYHNIELALAAYNWGIVGVDRVIERYGSAWDNIRLHVPRETRDFVQTVTRFYSSYLSGALHIPHNILMRPLRPIS